MSARDPNNDTETPAAASPIRVLLVEDAALTLYQLRKQGIHFVSHCVDSEPALREALTTFYPDVVLSDFSLPRFDGLSALQVALEVAADVPFIFVSGTIGEERAVEALRRGAVDSVLYSVLAIISSTKGSAQGLLERSAMRRSCRGNPIGSCSSRLGVSGGAPSQLATLLLGRPPS